MEYEKSLQDQLGKKYEVTLLNCDQYDKVILEEYKKCSKFRWILRKFFSVIKEHDQERAEWSSSGYTRYPASQLPQNP